MLSINACIVTSFIPAAIILIRDKPRAIRMSSFWNTP